MPILRIAVLIGWVASVASAVIYVDFATDQGTFTVELDAVQAPLAVANFLGLTDGSQTWRDPVTGAVRGGDSEDAFFADMQFYSALGAMAVLGGMRPYSGTDGNEYWEGPGYTILDDWTNGTTLVRGALAMAVFDGPHSGGAEFAVITSDALATTGHQWTRLGTVVGMGMTVVDDILTEVAEGSGRVVAQISIRDEDITQEESVALSAARADLPVVADMPLGLNLSPHAALQVSFGPAAHSRSFLSVTSNLLAASWSVLPGDWNKETNAVWSTVLATSIPGMGGDVGFAYGSQTIYSNMSVRTLPDDAQLLVSHTGADVEYQFDFAAGTGVWTILDGGMPVYTDTLSNLRQWTATANSVAVDFIIQDGQDLYRDIYWLGLDAEGAMTGRFYYESWWMNAIRDLQDWGTFEFDD